LVAAVAVLLLAACGDDGSGNSVAASTSEPATDTCPEGTTAVRDLPMVHVWLGVQPNDDGTPRAAASCGTFQYLDLPHEATIEGCSGASSGGGRAISEHH
jgi:hypothetical protein